ncbi:MAG: GntR family transcriptional regulator [Verrucomicrobia bacterium]|nr:GntR family transcriptional regulator [Verrucomicrobiota bacterium]
MPVKREPILNASRTSPPANHRIDRARLTAHIRKYILQKNLGRGDRLPPEGVLAKRCSVSRMTFRSAVDELVAQDFLERRHGVGVFVRKPLTPTIGLFTGIRSVTPPTSFFWQWFLTELRAQILARQGNSRLFLFNDDGQLDAVAHRAIRHHEIDGVLFFSTPLTADRLQREALDPLEGQRIPAVGIMKHQPKTLCRVNQDRRALIRGLIQRVAHNAHQEVGLAGREFHSSSVLLPWALEAARECGLRIKPEWILPGDADEPDSVARGRAIYHAFESLPRRPAALLFLDHFELQGFMHAQLARTRRVPDAPALVVVEARQAVLELPWPVIRVLIDPGPIIGCAIQMLFDLIAGRSVPAREVCMDPLISPDLSVRQAESAARASP